MHSSSPRSLALKLPLYVRQPHQLLGFLIFLLSFLFPFLGEGGVKINLWKEVAVVTLI